MRKTLLLLIFLPALLWAQEDANKLKFNYKGFIDTYHAMRASGDHDYMSSRTRARLEGGLEKGSTSGFISLNAAFNPIVKKQSGLFLREAFVEHSQKKWGIKLGRQIVTWGVADGLQVTDIISPMDYTEFLAQDYDDIRIPVNALRLSYGGMSVKAEVIFVPIPEYYELPTDPENPWGISLNGMNCEMNHHTPSKRISHSEYGARLCAYLNSVDFSFCALRTYNKIPAFSLAGITPEGLLSVDAYYGRMTMLGTDLSVSAGNFVIRAEAAAYLDMLHTPKNYMGAAKRGNDLVSLIGLDWYPGNDWTLMLQYCHTHIFGDDELSNYHNSGMATVNISKALLRNTMKLGAFGRIDCANNGAFFIRFNAEYQLTDDIAITLGYDWFRADAGMFALYKDNSEVWGKVKYSF